MIFDVFLKFLFESAFAAPVRPLPSSFLIASGSIVELRVGHVVAMSPAGEKGIGWPMGLGQWRLTVDLVW